MPHNEQQVVGWRLTPAAAARAQANRRDWIEDGVNYGSPDPAAAVWMSRTAALQMGWAESDIVPFAIDDEQGHG